MVFKIHWLGIAAALVLAAAGPARAAHDASAEMRDRNTTVFTHSCQMRADFECEMCLMGLSTLISPALSTV